MNFVLSEYSSSKDFISIYSQLKKKKKEIIEENGGKVTFDLNENTTAFISSFENYFEEIEIIIRAKKLKIPLVFE
jgi:hypothetical protein